MQGRESIFVFLIFFLFLSFFGCDSSKDDIYGDNTITDSNSVNDDETTEYMEKPDSDYRPGGGGKSDKDPIISDEPVVDDSDETSDIDSQINIPDEENEGIYSTDPDVSRCEPGIVTDSEKKDVLDRLNYIRSLHNLPPVTYEKNDDVITAECSLIIAANKKLSHTPTSDWDCYSNDAYTGCNKSNIYVQWGGDPLIVESESVVDAFMTDEGVESLGHRRWFIDPWLSHISFGRADDTENKVLGSAIKVINTTEQSIASSSIKFVAYPFEYYPAELYNDSVMLSFSVISDKTNKWKNNQVKFSSAAISIKDPLNKIIKITGMKFDNEGYGVPNNMRWFAESLKSGTKYNVVIKNVLINNVSTDYSYWFELK